PGADAPGYARPPLRGFSYTLSVLLGKTEEFPRLLLQFGPGEVPSFILRPSVSLDLTILEEVPELETLVLIHVECIRHIVDLFEVLLPAHGPEPFGRRSWARPT